MRLFDNIEINNDNINEIIMPYINNIGGYNKWSDDKLKEFLASEKKLYYVAPYINTKGDFICNNNVFTLSFRLDGTIEDGCKFNGLMYIIDSGDLFKTYGTYYDYEYFRAFFPLYVKGEYSSASTGDDYLFFKVFDNKEEAQAELTQWNIDNKDKQEKKKKDYVIHQYNTLIAQEYEIHEKIRNLINQYSFLSPHIDFSQNA